LLVIVYELDVVMQALLIVDVGEPQRAVSVVSLQSAVGGSEGIKKAPPSKAENSHRWSGARGSAGSGVVPDGGWAAENHRGEV
jgi:hypothetical protein